MRAYHHSPPVHDPDRDRLIVEHVEMGKRIALRLGRRLPPWLQQDDLIAAAMVGLAEAAARYDHARGEPFGAFAEKRIRGAILDELRRGDLLPRRVRTQARRVGEAIRDLEQRLGRAPEDDEIAHLLGVPVDHYREQLAQLTHIGFVDLDTSLAATTMPSPLPSPASEAERANLVTRLHRSLATLQPRDALLLSLYYVEELSYVEIGEVLGVSESRVCQLHARAVARLRVELVPDEEQP